MKRKYKITEEQKKALMQEGVQINANPSEHNNDVGAAVKQAANDAKSNGVKMDDAQIVVNGEEAVSEGRIITKRQLSEARLRYLKNESKVYSFANFLNEIQTKR